MRRICCFCEGWESGGIESFLNNVLLHMDLSEMEVDIVAACIKESVFTSGLKARGIHFIELSGKLRSPQNYRMFRNLLRERNYDVVHFNLFQGLSLYYVQIAKEEGVAVRIAHSHNTALRKSKGRVLKTLLHKAGSLLFTSKATDLWACSAAAAQFLFSAEKLAEIEFRFIPNGIETERFRFDQRTRDAVRSELGLTDSFVIGNVGRLCHQKNQLFLLDIFAEVQKIRSNNCLLLIGNGEDRQKLEEKAQSLGIKEDVFFYGTTANVEKLFWAMDVLAFPSRFEGLGIVVVEAQAAGLPVVCSEHIPQEAYVTTQISCCDLSCGAAVWAERLIQVAKQKSCDNTFDEAFDIVKVANLIQNMYKGASDDGNA